MQKMRMRSTSFCNSTFLFPSLLHPGIGSSYDSINQKNNAAFSISFLFYRTLLSSPLRATHFPSLSVFPTKDSSRFRASASKKGKKRHSTLFEMDGSEYDDDDELFDFDDELDGGDEDNEDEGMFLPFGKMNRWLENKPRGFGEGKVYDTSIEDKLLEEIEQSGQAQAFNVNSLKNNPVKAGSKKDNKQNKKVAEVVPSGIRVKVVNLPKKKNIHRDLKAAFDGVSGIINISPAVSGNKKTKDPVCKGFAFVDFKREEDATRFVQNFSGHSLTFGKIQKHIKCEMMNSQSHSPAREELSENDSMTPEVAISGLVDSANADFDIHNSSSDFAVESVSDEFDEQDDDIHNSFDEFDEQDDDIHNSSDEFDEQDDDIHNSSDEFDDQDDDISNSSSDLSLEIVSDGFDDQDDDFDGVEVGEGRDSLSVSSKAEPGRGDGMEHAFKAAAASISSNRPERIRALEKKLLAKGRLQRAPKEQKGEKLERIRSTEKKLVTKRNQEKVPKEQKAQKLDIPGSAKRLKIKEKALLTGVFSKYGLKSASTSKEES